MSLKRRALVRLLTTAPIALGVTTWTKAVIAAPLPSKGVIFTGAIAAPQSFTGKDLEQFPAQQINFTAPDGSVRKYTGALLRDVLTATKPVESDHNTLRQSYLLAKGTDNYFALFTWAELFISPAGDGAMLVYLRDGKPLEDDEGSVALVSARDLRPGPRYVKWLASVDFRRAAP